MLYCICILSSLLEIGFYLLMRVIRQSGVFYLGSAPLCPSTAESFRINLVSVFLGVCGGVSSFEK